MRYIVAAAAVAASGLIATSALAQAPQYRAGGPIRIGNMCLVDTDGGGANGFGYYQPCPQPQKATAVTKKKRKKS
jgi:hypothetical protein